MRYLSKKGLKKISVIVPVYNEQETVKQIIQKLQKVKYPLPYEIIVIDDGSTDKTQRILKSLNKIKLLINSKNRGKGFSLRRGFREARGDIIIIQDADLEYDPNDHLKLLALLNEDFINVVYGSRFMTGHHKPRYSLYYLGNIFLSYLTKILFSKNITDMETCYKSFKSKVIKGLNLKEDRFGIEPELTCKIIKKGYNIIEVPISYNSRSYEQGKKIGIKDGLRAIYLLFKFRLTQ